MTLYNTNDKVAKMKRSKAGKKAVRKTKARTIINNRMKDKIHSTERKFKKAPTPETLKAVYSIIDKGVKTGVLHSNTAGRHKSKYARMLANAKPAVETKPTKAKKEKATKKESKPVSEKK